MIHGDQRITRGESVRGRHDEQAVRRYGPERFDTRDPGAPKEPLALRFGLRQRRAPVRRPSTALRDGAVEQAAGLGREEQVADVAGAGRLPEDRDIVGVAAERRHVVTHPAQGLDLVEQAVVA